MKGINTCVGIKVVDATPMTKWEWNRKHKIPNKVINKTVDGYQVEYPDGYISWSPKDVFDDAYKTILEMSYPMALHMAINGFKIARKGWNGKGMFVYYIPKGKYAPATSIAKELVDEDGLVSYEPYLAIKNVKGTVSTWVPSINDNLATDWMLIP